MRNRFENFDLQEPSQQFLDTPDVDRSMLPNSGQEPHYRVESILTLEEEYLVNHCLFQDVKNIRSAIRQLWKNYRKGMSIVALSLTINTAICFVRDLEEEFLRQYPAKADYESIMHIFYGAQYLGRGHDLAAKQRPGDLFKFAVYDLASDVMLPTYGTLCTPGDQ